MEYSSRSGRILKRLISFSMYFIQSEDQSVRRGFTLLPVAYLNTIFFTSFPFLVDSNLLSCLPCSWPEFCHSAIADGDLPNIEHAPSALMETYR